MSPDSRDEAPATLAAYEPTPETRHRAALYVCTRFDAQDARPVLEALGLVEPLTEAVQVRRDSLGHIQHPGKTRR